MADSGQMTPAQRSSSQGSVGNTTPDIPPRPTPRPRSIGHAHDLLSSSNHSNPDVANRLDSSFGEYCMCCCVQRGVFCVMCCCVECGVFCAVCYLLLFCVWCYVLLCSVWCFLCCVECYLLLSVVCFVSGVMCCCAQFGVFLCCVECYLLLSVVVFVSGVMCCCIECGGFCVWCYVLLC